MTILSALILAEAVTGTQILLAAIPIIGSAIGGWFAYKQAKKAAAENAKIESERLAAENRKIDLSAYDALNRSLTGEIERLRADRDEDEERHARELANVTNKLTDLEDRCTEQADDLRAIVAWARTVIVIIRRPDVAVVLQEREVTIPPLPDLDTIERGRD